MVVARLLPNVRHFVLARSVERILLVRDHLDVANDDAPLVPNTGDYEGSGPRMMTDTSARPEGAKVVSRRDNGTDPSAPLTIERRVELEKTLSGLGLRQEEISVPIGTDGRYLLQKVLGRGSMGSVYLAHDVELERKVAIKVMSRRFDDDSKLLRLRREARALAQIDHPNVIKVHDIGKEDGERFIAMEYVEGHTLREWQRQQDLHRLLQAYQGAGRGLAAAHAARIVHRDFKPDNVLIDIKGSPRARVGDFGLAGLMSKGRDDDVLSSNRVLVGTPPYMAPEQLRRERSDARSDQHQFCVALWEAVAGVRPFGAARRLEVDTGPPPRPKGMPRWLYRILTRGLAFDRCKRFDSMEELLDSMLRWHQVQRLRPWALGIGLFAVAGTVALASRPGPCVSAATPMSTIWSPEARDDIQAAFGDSPDAGDGEMARYLIEQLDRASGRWKTLARQTCEARESSAVIDRAQLNRREICVARWAERIRDRIEWLRLPDPSSRSQAFQLVAPLALTGQSCEVPPLIIDEQVARLLEQAEQAELLRDLEHARKLASEGVALAQVRGAPCPVKGPDGNLRSSESAAAWFRLGHVLGELGESTSSLEALDVAHHHARACDDQHRDAEALVHTAKVLAAALQNVGEARSVLDDAFIALGHVEEPTVSLLRYDERMAAGIIAEHAGDYAAARLHAREARAALGSHEQQPILAAKLDLNTGVAFQKEGRFEDAGRAFDRAATRVSDALGREHPQARRYVAFRSLNLGLAAQERGDHDGAGQHLRQAAASSERAVAIAAMTALAQEEYVLGDEAVTLARAKELLAALEEASALPPKVEATAQTTAGQILFALGDPHAKTVILDACLRWRELQLAAPEATCLISLAEAGLADSELNEVLRLLERLQQLELDPNGQLARRVEDIKHEFDEKRTLELDSRPP